MDTVKTILIVAGAIIVAAVAWMIISFITAVAVKIISVLVFLGVLYVIFLFARNAMHRQAPER